MAVLAAKHPNVFRRPYGILAEGERSTTIPKSGFENNYIYSYKNKGGNPEYSNHKKYGSIANRVGENPLNGKGVALT